MAIDERTIKTIVYTNNIWHIIMINVDGENMGIKLRYQQHMAIHQWFFWVARRFGEFERPQIIKSPK
jgi:hypothetical protein